MSSRDCSSRARQAGARFVRDTRGVVFIEYAVLVALVAFVIVAMLLTLGPSVIAEYSARRATLYSHAP